MRESYKSVDIVMDTSVGSTRYPSHVNLVINLFLSSGQKEGEKAATAQMQESLMENINILVTVKKSV